MSTTTLPPELVAQMKKPRDKVSYSAHDLTLLYCENNGPATVDELLIYVWRVTGRVTSRGYAYHILKRLRDRGYLVRVEMDGSNISRHMLTDDGEKYLAERELEYVVPTERLGDD